MSRRPGRQIIPPPLNALDQQYRKEWLVENQKRIAELDAIIERSSGRTVFSRYARAK